MRRALGLLLLLAGCREARTPFVAWADLDRYRAANAALPADPARVVFIGDSITEEWAKRRPGFFDGAFVNRGIGGQTSPQLLLRFEPDVLALHPAAVHIMIGTNDVGGVNLGPIAMEATLASVRAMIVLAQARGVRVVLAAIPPAARVGRADPAGPEIARRNRALEALARRTHVTWVDYGAALGDGDAIRRDYSDDGLHPNVAGYDAMEPVATAAIRSALAQ